MAIIVTGCIILHVQPCPYAKVSLFQLGLAKVVKLICKVCSIHVGENLQKICLSMVTLCLQNLQKGGNVGIDPCCISVDTAHRWEQAFSKYGQKLVPLKENLVDKIWESRPPHIVAPVCIQPLEFTGRSAKEKISDLREKLCQEKANAIVVTTLDEVILVGCVH